MTWPFDHTYARDLDGLYAEAAPTPAPNPGLLALNRPLADELGLDPDRLASPEGVAVLAGSVVPDTARPIAQAYAGHQFGQFAGVLGDGRAVLLGELVDRRGRRRDVALKGSVPTRFSRGGDGRAALGPVLREYLVSEAMHALGIPTTRSLAAVSTGEPVLRRPPEPGAVLTRVADSHLRVGTFELVRVAGDVQAVRRLAAYARARHFPELTGDDPVDLLAAVADRQARLVARWMAAGFIHGVMNTDNTAISGETIDYGPCAFLEAHDPDAVFSSIDHQGRYRYAAQPAVAAWNLARLAECLIAPLPESEAPATVERAQAELARFAVACGTEHRRLIATKIGLPAGGDLGPGADGSGDVDRGADGAVVDDLLALMRTERLDHTLTFRRLARVLRGETDAARGQVLDLAAWDDWQRRWLAATADRPRDVVAKGMDAVNPAYIPRNHRVEEALDAARAGELGPFETLLSAIRDPFVERSGLERYAEPAPAGFTEGYRTFCGT